MLLDSSATFFLGRVLGIPLRIHISWLVILGLVLWTTTTAVFPAWLPGRSQATYAAMGIAGTALFFASLLAHELSHAVLARRRGIGVEGITLFLFGGVAEMRREADRPGDELWIAAAGPLASFALGAAFYGLAWAAVPLGDVVGVEVRVVSLHLALVNIALGVFNLIPAFPLDGGRIFRAAAWKATGDLTRATRWAALGGQGFGILLVGAGAAEVLLTWAVGGVWLALVGLFVRRAARESYRQHELRRLVAATPARAVMRPLPEPAALVAGPRIDADEPMARAIEILRGTGAPRLAVVAGGRLAGHLLLRDVAAWLERVARTGRAEGAAPRGPGAPLAPSPAGYAQGA